MKTHILLLAITLIAPFCFATDKLPMVDFYKYDEVKLLPSPFLSAMEKDVELINAMKPDKLLSGFRQEAGLLPKDSKYEGWESQGVAGQFLGHYLSANAIYYVYSKNPQTLYKINYCIDELELCQMKNGNGFLGAFPEGKRIFEEIGQGRIYSKGFDLNGGWVPLYVIHKLLAGLIDVYQYTDNKKSMQIAIKLSDFLYNTFFHLTDDQIQKVMDCEHGGIKEALANMYHLTNDKRYLDLSNKFTHKSIVTPLSNHIDDLQGLHANTQVPKIIGSARYFELTGNSSDSVVAGFFWNTVVNNHTYANGGNSDGEHFGEAGHLSDRLSLVNSETCNTYNMLKLTEHLFQWKPSVHYMDYYEKALYNHILSTINPQTGEGMYYTPLASGGKKGYLLASYPVCCSGTSMENHVKYNRAIYAHQANDIYVNLFIPSILERKKDGLKITQTANLPETDNIQLTINVPKPEKIKLLIRNPHWSSNTTLTINNEVLNLTQMNNGYIIVDRIWKDNDKVCLKFDLEPYIEKMPDNKKRVALFWGPQLLAANLGEAEIDYSKDIPVIISGKKDIKEWISKKSHYPLSFRMNVSQTSPEGYLMPLSSIYKEHYQVYWDVFSDEEWSDTKKKYAEELRKNQELEKSTIDYCVLGEMQPERDHNMNSDAGTTGLFNKKKYRSAWIGGWFSFDMVVLPEKTTHMFITFWGEEYYPASFKIEVDGQLLKQPEYQDKTKEFIQVKYILPEELTQGKEKVRIKIESAPDRMTPKVFNCRTTSL